MLSKMHILTFLYVTIKVCLDDILQTNCNFSLRYEEFCREIFNISSTLYLYILTSTILRKIKMYWKIFRNIVFSNIVNLIH